MGMSVEDLPVTLEFDSHFSRLCDRFRHSYWKINKKLYMYKTEANIMKVDPVKHGKIAGRELTLWRDMFATGQKKVIKFIIVRAFLKAKPVLKHRPIWLFLIRYIRRGTPQNTCTNMQEARRMASNAIIWQMGHRKIMHVWNAKV